MENKFAVLIPVTNQIGYDTFQDTFITLILDKNMTFYQIMDEVRRHKKDATEDIIRITPITLPKND